jgi:hypothetical protein
MQHHQATRRVILAGLAVSPAVAAATLTTAGVTALSLKASLETADAAPALALSNGRPDPIFAAIEEFRAAYDDWGVVLLATDDEGPLADAACNRTHKASNALITTRPTTMAGVAALLAYVYEFVADGTREWMDFPSEGDGSWESELCGSLAVSINRIVAAGGVL